MTAIEPIAHGPGESTPTTTLPGLGGVQKVGRAAELRAPASAPPAGDDVVEAKRVSRELQEVAPHVTFSVDRNEGKVVVRIVNPVTREVVRQIPLEEFVEIRRRVDQYLGMLADETA